MEECLYNGLPVLYLPVKEPYLVVNWEKLNLNMVKNLPKLKTFPISSCPQDPNVYPDASRLDGRILSLALHMI